MADGLTNEVLVEEYGFPPSCQLLEPDTEPMPGDYLLDPVLKQIALVGRGYYFHVHKKNRLAGKVRQQTKRRPDRERFVHVVRINADEAPLAHQMVLLPKGSRVEVPKGRFGRTTEKGILYKDGELAFTDINQDQIQDLHPEPAPPAFKKRQGPPKKDNRGKNQ